MLLVGLLVGNESYSGRVLISRQRRSPLNLKNLKMERNLALELRKVLLKVGNREVCVNLHFHMQLLVHVHITFW